MMPLFPSRQHALGRTRNASRRGFAAGFLALVVAPLPVEADVSAGSAVEVAAHESVWAMRTDVAIRPNGEFVVAWERYPEAGLGNVLVRRFAADGTPLGKVFLVTSAPGHQGEPAVAIADNGKFLVTWSGEGAEGPAGVYARVFEADGSPSTGPFLVHSGSHKPSATEDGDGFAIASAPGVQVTRLDANGAVRGGFLHLETDVSGVQVRELPASQLLLAWSSTHYRSLTQDSEGDVARVDAVVLSSSDEVVHEFRTNEPRTDPSYDYILDGEQRISLATGADGTFAVAHDSSIPRYVYNVDARDGPYPLGAKVEMFDAAAESFVAYYLADVPADGLVADVAMSPGGNIVASVETDRIGIRSVDCRGVIQGDSLVYLSDEDAAVSGSSIAINERGDGVVVWSESHGGEYSLAARRITMDGGCALCGDADAGGTVTAGDALVALRAAVGGPTCALDRCDVDGSGKVGSNDALDILRRSVAAPGVELTCSDAPQIEHSQSASFFASSYGWESPFSLIADDGGAVLTWSDIGAEGGRTFSRRMNAALDFDPIEIVAGPEMWSIHFDATGCAGQSGVALAWAAERSYFPEGLTLDLSTILLSLPGGPVVQMHPDSIGAHRFGSVACLSDGRYAVSWMSRCGAIERLGQNPDDAEYFRPEECDEGLPDGAQLRVLEADGSPVAGAQTLLVSDELHQETALAPAGDHFVAAAGSVLQVRSNDGALLDETTVEVESKEAGLTCLGGRCVRTDDGRVLIFDADDLEDIQEVVVQPIMQLGAQRTIAPRQVSVACEAGGVCMLAWIAQDTTELSAYWVPVAPGLFARPFDLATGELGETIRLPRESSSAEGVVVAAVEPGVFLVAADASYQFTVHRIEIR